MQSKVAILDRYTRLLNDLRHDDGDRMYADTRIAAEMLAWVLGRNVAQDLGGL